MPLEVQKAKYGKDCPPHVINEMEDINNEIHILEQRLNQLQSKIQTNREFERSAVNNYNRLDHTPLKAAIEPQVNQNEKSSSLLQKYYHSLETQKIRVIAFTILSFYLPSLYQIIRNRSLRGGQRGG